MTNEVKIQKMIGLALAMLIYAPISMLVFGTTPGEIFERAYFLLGGAAIALWTSDVTK